MRRALLAVALLLAACDWPSTLWPVPQPITYQLIGFGGVGIPQTVLATADGETRLVAGTLTLAPDGQFTETLTQEIVWTEYPIVGRADATRSGTWQQTGTTVTFWLPDGSGWTGETDGAMVRYAVAGQRFLWEVTP